ncbi:TlpA family protein disulfide reductase [Curtobacterium flaccumfaciens]|uniref:TlpA family protein disulfide reductase n=1 Tax=Curtobacterium flaccumfaciens TaxID=2035 RepID=UPI001BDEBDB8|nr:TlpA disulfide reductase family protein [Curtobacterium flaccumfaciens]MBT1633971.1 TlpA family protein disulfide reductase [Curtobacterium flaccumfaciens pv. oortii]MCX2846675.1 TlpA disulfide reductase family protein [Curtobacterium flaccumfaciens pv. oortii]
MTRRPSWRRAAPATAAIMAVMLLAGCAGGQNGTLSSQYRGGETKNYVSGDGTVTQVPTSNRSAPVQFDETAMDGTQLSSEELRGQVVVLNFWYASCPPCRAEAKHLNKVAERFASRDVQFIGVNVRDAQGTAEAFERRFNVTYPSILDNDTGRMQLALSGDVAPNAVPTTIVLDVRGRVAVRILGAIGGPGTLATLIEDELTRA